MQQNEGDDETSSSWCSILGAAQTPCSYQVHDVLPDVGPTIDRGPPFGNAHLRTFPEAVTLARAAELAAPKASLLPRVLTRRRRARPPYSPQQPAPRRQGILGSGSWPALRQRCYHIGFASFNLCFIGGGMCLGGVFMLCIITGRSNPGDYANLLDAVIQETTQSGKVSERFGP